MLRDLELKSDEELGMVSLKKKRQGSLSSIQYLRVCHKRYSPQSTKVGEEQMSFWSFIEGDPITK